MEMQLLQTSDIYTLGMGAVAYLIDNTEKIDFTAEYNLNFECFLLASGVNIRHTNQAVVLRADRDFEMLVSVQIGDLFIITPEKLTFIPANEDFYNLKDRNILGEIYLDDGIGEYYRGRLKNQAEFWLKDVDGDYCILYTPVLKSSFFMLSMEDARKFDLVDHHGREVKL